MARATMDLGLTQNFMPNKYSVQLTNTNSRIDMTKTMVRPQF